MEYNPLRYFWIAHYGNGEALPQFDPEDGHENFFRDIDQKRLVKFGWYPFMEGLKKIIPSLVTIDPSLRPIEISLVRNQDLIAFRRNGIVKFDAHLCGNCGFLWQQMTAPTDARIPFSSKWFFEKILIDGKEQTFQWGICPRCGTHNGLLCPKCGKHKNKYGRCSSCGDAVINEKCIKCGKDQLGPKIDFIYRCPECGLDLPDKVSRPYLERRMTEYVLGWKQLIAGRSQKVLIWIHEDGSISIESEGHLHSAT